MNPEWQEAARVYNGLGDSDRAAYWAELGPEQQRMLEQALKETQPALQYHAAPPRKQFFKTAMAGCVGMILGSLLTLAVEFLALSAGVQAVANIFKGGGPSAGDASEVDPLDPMPEFCKNGMVNADANEKFACFQWAERHKDD